MRTAKSRRTPKVNEKRLLAYAAAAGAALAAAGPADADVVYGVFDKDINTNTSFTAQMGTAGPSFKFKQFTRTNSIVGFVSGAGTKNPSVILPSTKSFGAKNFQNNSKISVTPPAISGFVAYLFRLNSGNVFYNFLSPSGGYLGITFDLDDGHGRHYGWIKIDNIAPDYTSYHLNDWAYETDASTPIIAGQTAVPEPTSCALALIAMGAGGLAVYRKRKQGKQEREGE